MARKVIWAHSAEEDLDAAAEYTSRLHKQNDLQIILIIITIRYILCPL